MRRVITGHNENGKSIVVLDGLSFVLKTREIGMHKSSQTPKVIFSFGFMTFERLRGVNSIGKITLFL